jgi:NTE family protein
MSADRSTYPDVTLTVAGIFKGGGARGIVYAGALRELRARGIWFETVAGSSAGAITAALIAMGTHPDDFADAAEEALQQVPRNLARGALPWLARSLFRTDRLQSWLEVRLRTAVGWADDRAGPVTFADLVDVCGIDLNVVAMDLHRKQPIVFNRTTTPNCSVAASVVASCAIPVAMPAGRVLMPADPESRTFDVHRLVDGGAWANYPAFVYSDESFRAYYGLGELREGLQTLGFVLERDPPPMAPDGAEVPVPQPPPAPRPGDVHTPPGAMSPFDRGSARRVGIAGALLSWWGLRWVVAFGVPVLISTVMLQWFVRQGDNRFDSFAGLDEPLQAPAIVAAGAIILGAAYLSLTVAAIQARFAHEVIDIGLPSLRAALSVGTGVPDWIGHAANDRVVRLWSPAGITTTAFRVPDHLRDTAIVVAEQTAGTQLDRLFPEQPRVSFDAVARTRATPARAERAWTPWLRRRRDRRYAATRVGLLWRSVLVVILVWFSIGVIADSDPVPLLERFGFLILAYVLLVPIAASLVRALGYRRQVNQGLLTERGAPTTHGVGQAVGGLVLMATFGVLSVALSEDLNEDELLTYNTLFSQSVLVCLVAVGAGGLLSAAGGAVARRRHRQHQAEIARITGIRAPDRGRSREI